MDKTHTTLEDLPAEWRKRAEYLRAYGDSTTATHQCDVLR